MSAVLRHLTVRLWITALAGGLSCIGLLPYYQRLMGLTALWVPVLMVMAAFFMLAGLVMNRLGAISIRRKLAEAAVWERAGSGSEAEAAFERANALYDGFWLSPLQRRRSADWIVMRLARFHLAQPSLSQSGRAVVLSFLQGRPDDEDMALGWLEKMVDRESCSQGEYDTAALINDALPEHAKVQRLLMKLYLSCGRCDFEAVQTYRRVWHRNEVPDTLILDLAHLLMQENLLNDWALQVYLKGYALGDAGCLDGIAAGIRHLRPDAENRDDLAAAGIIIAGLGERPCNEFEIEPAQAIELTEEEEELRLPAGPGWSERVRQILRAAAGAASFPFGRTRKGAQQLSQRLLLTARRSLWPRLLRISALALLAVGLFVLVVLGWRSVRLQLTIPHDRGQAASSEASPIPDPFTIQVAAYLKPEDARSLVERLKKQKVDAFFTKAASSNRTWYQVKISHFPTRDAARAYGEDLKAKGWIDDFYVANYTP